MKKFLAPIVAIAAVAGFSSAVFAQADTQTIKQEGSVKGNCTLAVENGKLPADAGFVNSIESSVKGKISTVCNTIATAGEIRTVKLVTVQTRLFGKVGFVS